MHARKSRARRKVQADYEKAMLGALQADVDSLKQVRARAGIRACLPAPACLLVSGRQPRRFADCVWGRDVG